MALDSATQIATLQALGGGFGLGRMQIDFSIHVVRATAGAPTRTLSGFPFDIYFLPDCEPIGTPMPIPANAAIEGNFTPGDLSCDNQNEDCHLIVVQDNLLYEGFRVNTVNSQQFQAQCLAIWDLNVIYPPEGRGEHCTSADAAGFPIAPLLFNADEIAQSLQADGTGDGDLGHAIRFILPNDRMASDSSLGGVLGRLYVRPASHAGGPSGPVSSVAYGSRLRLRADFPLDGYNPAARVILNTMKRFGIVLADGGIIALTAESDLYTDTRWSDLGITAQTFFNGNNGAAAVQVADFDVIETGPRIAETYECVRTVLPSGVIFIDGFEG